MTGSVAVYGKKIFSISLVFNSLITVACAVELLFGFYRAFPLWQPFSPYLFDGNLVWFAVLAAVINIYPSASIGRALKTGRFLFHHYVYGFFVLILAVFYVVAFGVVSLVNLFLVDTTSVAVNAGRFFLLGGLALVLDDLPDVSKKIESALNWLKRRAFQGRKLLQLLQLLTGLGSFYLFVAISFWTWQNPQLADAGHYVLAGTLLVTCLTSLWCVKRKTWLKLVPTK